LRRHGFSVDAGYSAARRPRLSHMLPTPPAIFGLGKAGEGTADVAPGLVWSRPERGQMRRASAPPRADAQSSGKNLNMPNKNVAPQASRRLANAGVRADRLAAGVLALVINCVIQVEIRFRRRRLSRSPCLPLRVAPVPSPTRLQTPQLPQR